MCSRPGGDLSTTREPRPLSRGSSVRAGINPAPTTSTRGCSALCSRQGGDSSTTKEPRPYGMGWHEASTWQRSRPGGDSSTTNDIDAQFLRQGGDSSTTREPRPYGIIARFLRQGGDSSTTIGNPKPQILRDVSRGSSALCSRPGGDSSTTREPRPFRHLSGGDKPRPYDIDARFFRQGGFDKPRPYGDWSDTGSSAFVQDRAGILRRQRLCSVQDRAGILRRQENPAPTGLSHGSSALRSRPGGDSSKEPRPYDIDARFFRKGGLYCHKR